jgi:hypothetical protein
VIREVIVEPDRSAAHFGLIELSVECGLHVIMPQAKIFAPSSKPSHSR